MPYIHAIDEDLPLNGLGCGADCACRQCSGERRGIRVVFGEPGLSGFMYPGAFSGFGEPPVVVAPAKLPRVTKVNFRNTNGTRSTPTNCCAMCTGTGINLGVGQGGTASNGMEMQFELADHRPGIEYDILRTRRSSMWQRRAGVWTRLESFPMGTDDDHHNDDECLTPVGGRIFVIDTPGYSGTTLPAANGTIWGATTAGVASNADATDVVRRSSYAEWVIARSRADKIGWTPISPGPFTFWHSVAWLTRDLANQWVMGPCSRIALGPLSAAIINSAPTCAIPTPRELLEEARRWTDEILQRVRTILDRLR